MMPPFIAAALASTAAKLLPFKTIALLLAFGALAAALLIQTARLDIARGSLEAKTATTAGLQFLLSAQNAGIASLQADTAARTAAAENAQALLAKQAKQHARSLAALRSAAIPAHCEGALDWARDRAPELSRGWGGGK